MLVDKRDWHDSVLLSGSDEEPEPLLSEEQKAASWDSEYWLRLDAEVRYFGGLR